MIDDFLLEPQAAAELSELEKRAVYEVMRLRRDVRHFQPDREIEPAVLTRILSAAHAAPSVGLSQPWGFVLVRSPSVRGRIRESFLRCREREAARFSPERRALYLAHRLEGILECALNVCVAVDLRPRGEPILVLRRTKPLARRTRRGHRRRLGQHRRAGGAVP
jgi:nitroreductase